MSDTKLLVCGSIALDRIMSFSARYKDLIKPDKLDVLSLSQLLDKLENSPGGIGANIAYNIAQLGEKPVLLGSVGSDAKDYVQQLAVAGVDTSHLHFSDLATSSFNVISDSDGNQVGGFYPGAMGDSSLISFAPWKGQNVLAVISAYDPPSMGRLVAECQTYNLPYVYDPGQQIANPGTDVATGISAARLVFVNEYELSMLCERLNTQPDDLKRQLPIIITTKGKKGSLIEGSALAETLKIPIAEPSQVIDPTGAGDGYRAGFLYGYLRQWELHKCGQLGAVVASFIVESSGTQHHISKQQIIDRFKQTFNQEIAL